MKLTLLERNVLLTLLPREGDFMTLKAIRKAREWLAASEDEQKAVNMRRVDENRIEWDASKDEPKEIDLPGAVIGIITGQLKELDKQKQLTEQHFTVYEKFVGE